MIEALDQSVGRIVAKLDDLGLAEQTVIVLTGDNGGDYDNTTSGLRDRKGYSHEGGVREPLIVKWPGKIKRGSRCVEPVIGMDFYPTFLEMAGLPAKKNEHLDGVSIWPLLKDGSTELKRKKLYWHYPHYHRTKPYGAIRDGDWKLIEFFENGELELFNLKMDPFERKNLAAENPRKAATLLADLKAWRQSVGAQTMTLNPAYDPNSVSRLRKAGKKKK
jgi:arylsulfatase A-like enzyme